MRPSMGIVGFLATLAMILAPVEGALLALALASIFQWIGYICAIGAIVAPCALIIHRREQRAPLLDEKRYNRPEQALNEYVREVKAREKGHSE